MVDEKINKCISCGKKALYHDKLAQTHCEECYWNKDEKTKQKAKKRSWKFYEGTTTYIKCPYCDCGDTCSNDNGRIYCIAQHCGFFHPEGSVEDKDICDCRLKEQKAKEEQLQVTKDKKEQEQHDKWKKITDEIYLLSQKELDDLNSDDYIKVKKLQKENNSLLKQIREDSILKALIEVNQQSLKELEEQIHQREKAKAIGDYERCWHKTIKWNQATDENPYCANCGASNDNSTKFLKALCRFYYKNIQKELNHLNIKPNRYTLGEENYFLYRNLMKGDEFSKAEDIQQTYFKIEQKINKISSVNNNNNSIDVRERERERANQQPNQFNTHTHTHTQSSNPLNQINHLFSQFRQKTQSIYGENSPITQNLTQEQAETISILEKSSESEQKEYLSLISKLQPFLEKMPNLNQEEQTKFMSISQELENFEKRLKEKQMKSEEKSNRNKLILGIGGGVLGLGLVGLIIYLITKKEKSR